MASRFLECVLFVALLLTVGQPVDGFYTKSSPVLQLDAKNYDSLINWSNHSSIVEFVPFPEAICAPRPRPYTDQLSNRFYAPWCGHCKNLKPAYEKAAKNLAGLAKVAAVNCDEEVNKPLCGQMGIKGFPTLKTVTPGSKAGKPKVAEYQGERTAKGIVEAVIDKIPNHVKKLQDKDVEGWLAQSNTSSKAILFTDKASTSGLLRALAIDFLGSISVAQIRQKEKKAVATFGIAKFPSLVLLPGGEKKSLLYDGELKKDPLVKFFSQVAAPNPEKAPKGLKAAKSKTVKASKASSSSSVFSEASASQRLDEASGAAASASTVVLEDFDASESPNPIVPQAEQPIVMVEDDIPPLNSLATPAELTAKCLGPKTGTCVLALLPAPATSDAALPAPVVKYIQSLAIVAERHAKRQARIFPFFAVPATNEAATTLRTDLGLKANTELEIVAVNGKKGWWRHFTGVDGSVSVVETFIDAIKLGEGKKEKLPEGVIPKEPVKEEHDEL